MFYNRSDHVHSCLAALEWRLWSKCIHTFSCTILDPLDWLCLIIKDPRTIAIGLWLVHRFLLSNFFIFFYLLKIPNYTLALAQIVFESLTYFRISLALVHIWDHHIGCRVAINSIHTLLMRISIWNRIPNKPAIPAKLLLDIQSLNLTLCLCMIDCLQLALKHRKLLFSALIKDRVHI